MAAVLTHGKGFFKYMPVEVIPLLVPVLGVSCLAVYTGVQTLRKHNDIVANKSKPMPFLQSPNQQINPLHHVRFSSRAVQSFGGFMTEIPHEFQEKNAGRHDSADPVHH
eukprot:CAMPEP_0184656992 /NCGR_PEP_ID=MMETSP0308-20130426/16891_1 /TAXON_ID=38269 /ORGANISM="Gloeochaete witrockiana, Strain SAG 46.84" /LENGTH=108 /DNA_ID=CAMNT_0027094337 /DNA_START=148 /DNA_END=474 /DNA_ORIENTATION=+